MAGEVEDVDTTAEEETDCFGRALHDRFPWAVQRGVEEDWNPGPLVESGDELEVVSAGSVDRLNPRRTIDMGNRTDTAGPYFGVEEHVGRRQGDPGEPVGRVLL